MMASLIFLILLMLMQRGWPISKLLHIESKTGCSSIVALMIQAAGKSESGELQSAAPSPGRRSTALLCHRGCRACSKASCQFLLGEPARPGHLLLGPSGPKRRHHGLTLAALTMRVGRHLQLLGFGGEKFHDLGWSLALRRGDAELASPVPARPAP